MLDCILNYNITVILSEVVTVRGSVCLALNMLKI